MKKIFLSLLILIIISVSKNSNAQKLEKLWETDSVFKVPESVIFDKVNKVLYVSNIDGTQPWAKDGFGSIGKLGLDGKPIEIEWIKGLNSPKGMGIYKNILYVADLTHIVVIDIKSSSIKKYIEIDSAVGLNDITIDAIGIIYVSDSRAKKIYKIKDGIPELFLENLKGPNGLLAFEENLLLLDAGGLYEVMNDKTLVKITDGMEGGTDGVEHIGENEFLVSCWQGAIWYVNKDGEKKLLLDTRNEKINTADIGFNANEKIVYVPTFWKNKIVAYKLVY